MAKLKKQQKYKAIYAKDYEPSDFLIDKAELIFSLNPKVTLVNAKLHIRRNPKLKAATSALVLDGHNLELQEIKLDGNKLPKKTYTANAHSLSIFKTPNKFILETVVKICPERNLTCTGLYLTGKNFCTQNEPQGFRGITYFIDRPDILSKFTTTIIGDTRHYPVLLSNGNLMRDEKISTYERRVTWLDPYPKSSYLFALVAGKFSCLEDTHLTPSGRKVTLRVFSTPKQIDQCKYALYFLKQAMLWEEENFGLEYDLDLYQIVAIDDLNYGAMENKGLNVFNSNLLLASQHSATDSDFRKIAAVVAHEYFHNWTGNRVTCQDWFQIGLKEGLTTLREQLFMEDAYGYAVNRLDSVRTMRNRQFSEDAGPLAHPIRLKSYIEVDNFYTTTVYYKSAEIARMFITMFGKKTFQKIMKRFLAKFDGKAVTIEDFLSVASNITKINLDQFKLWYDEAGTPEVRVTDKFKNSNYALKFEQINKKSSRPFYIPIALALIDKNGKNTKTQNLLLNKKEQTLKLKGLSTKPCPSLLRGFSAPINVVYQYTDEELLYSVKYDNDPIARWLSCQKLITTNIVKLCKNGLKNKKFKTPEILTQAFCAILEDSAIDRALKAQMLQFPSESYLLDTMPNMDISLIHKVCESLKLALASTLKNIWLKCYQDNIARGSRFNFDKDSIGKRALKNLALHFLMQLNANEIFAIAHKQLITANNLTDICGALIALSNSKYTKRKTLLESYYKKWQTEPNLVNKWLSINATIKLPNTLTLVKKLLKHKGFDYKNPNKVSALIRGFSEGNLVNFHAKNGSGYKFLADQIICIDSFNPHLAASLTTPLTSGHKLDKARRQLMRKELARIKNKKNLSKNVYEIVNKALQV